MASEYTPNYNLDLYVSTDKPNLRDQYNGAMGKIDKALLDANNKVVDYGNQVANLSTRVENVETTVGGLDGRITANAEQIAAVKTTADGAAANATAAKTTADSALSLAQTNEQGISLAETRITELEKVPADVQANAGEITRIKNMFPVTTANIADAAVTAQKIDRTAANAILQGLTIRYFDSHENNADNAGMVVPEGAQLAGFYIPELYILVITRCASEAGTDIGNNDAPVMVLPSYVPTVTEKVFGPGCSWMKWTSDNGFAGWSGLTLTVGNRGIAPNTSESSQAGDMCGSVVFYLRPFATGVNVASTSYEHMAAFNGLVK
jgi:hypothetical protein